MAWQGAMINMLRVLIDDNPYDGTYAYSDDRLTQVLATAAYQVNTDLSFANNYVVDLNCCTITPDPYDNIDKSFVNLTVLKAACIVDQGIFRQKALLSGLVAKCGPATLDTDDHLDGFKALLEQGPCAMYEKLKEEKKFGEDHYNNIVHFVLSPFVGNDFDPQREHYYKYDERFIR